MWWALVESDRIKALANDLGLVFRFLDAAKYASTPAREGGGCAPPGPRTPGNSWAVHTCIDETEKLFELVRDAANTITPQRVFRKDAQELAAWLGFNADAVSRLDWVEDLTGELRAMVRRINNLLNPPELTVAKAMQRWEGAPSILVKARRAGHKVTQTDLYNWSRRGRIQHRKTITGATQYLLVEVIEHAANRRGVDND